MPEDLFHAPTKPTPQYSAHSTGPTSPKAVWTNQLSQLVRQAFDIFHTFGKDGKSLENVTLGFIAALEGCEMRDISAAFKQWLREKEKFPAPAEIRKLSENYKTIRLRSLGGFIPKVWTQIIRDLETNEILSEISNTANRIAPYQLSGMFPGRHVRMAYRQD